MWIIDRIDVPRSQDSIQRHGVTHVMSLVDIKDKPIVGVESVTVSADYEHQLTQQ